MDVLAGLVIVGALTMALAGVLGRQHRAVQKLADTRAAMQVAETVLTDLQSRRGGPGPGPGAAADTSVDVRPAVAADPADSGARAGKWVEVVVTVRAGRASLVGAVPASAAVTPAPNPGDAR
jgi:hypothetical protein